MSLADWSKSWLIALLFGLLLALPGLAQTKSSERLKEVADRGSHVMPFELKLTQHIFTKTKSGGIQQVIVRNANDEPQVKLIRQHLSAISQQFKQGDFSNPAKIHGKDMPGLAELRKAKPGQIKVLYKELENGAEITYTSDEKELIDAIHRWFDAQLTDHGSDATPGHPHEAMHNMHMR